MSGKRVAVIDNDADLQALMVELLLVRGFEPVTAADLEGAWKIVWEETPALILLDLWLETPESGWDMLDRLKREPATRDVPVVLVTGGAEVLADRADWLTEHGVEILAKPFDLDEFDRCVDHALGLA